MLLPQAEAAGRRVMLAGSCPHGCMGKQTCSRFQLL